jgi:hypothetical protein
MLSFGVYSHSALRVWFVCVAVQLPAGAESARLCADFRPDELAAVLTLAHASDTHHGTQHGMACLAWHGCSELAAVRARVGLRLP